MGPTRNLAAERTANFLNSPLELWGGMESTINRVGDQYFDQLQRSGHLTRTGDLELFRSIGLRKLRYALQWERFEATQSWKFFDTKLAEMRRLEMEPIAGLVHHGSGPPSTSLLDPAFPEKLAAFALCVAERYPWIGSYTPVNEPQTTARFSGLYSHWYPHHHSMSSYLRALLHQVKASVLSMRAVRTVNPRAHFVHTEDGGKTWSTRELEDERELREHRRWLGVDLLCGRVDEQHPLFPFLLRNGIPAGDILWFAENPCPPDVLGLNYYVTSDRFLDHRTHLYPPVFVGGDTGTEPLVDIEAVRVRSGGIAGVKTILLDAWKRYHLPVAITEAHLGGSPQEQIRWLTEVWKGAQEARAEGANCVAVVVWALLGSFDWCYLVTRSEGVYEPGVFDLTDGTPRPTELTPVVERLARGLPIEITPTLPSGWWNRQDRLTFPAAD